jgi:hypothetical protein
MECIYVFIADGRNRTLRFLEICTAVAILTHLVEEELLQRPVHNFPHLHNEGYFVLTPHMGPLAARIHAGH